MTFDAPAVRFATDQITDPGDFLLEPSVHARTDAGAAQLLTRSGPAVTTEVRRALLKLVDRTASEGDCAISFGPFRLLPKKRLLLQGNAPVRLGSRAFDILIALIERPGEVVGKNELISRAWLSTVVEESNLKVQVSALRRTLGGGHAGIRYIETVPGRGYCVR